MENKFNKIYDIIMEDTEQFFNQYYKFKNNINKINWSTKNNKLSVFTDKLKELNNYFKNKEFELKKTEGTSINKLIDFKNALKYNKECADIKIQEYLNELIDIEHNKTRRIVLRDICKRYDIFSDNNLLKQLYDFLFSEKRILNTESITTITIPTSGVEKLIYDYKPWTGLLSNNDTQIGPGEFYLAFKYGLVFSPKAHVDLGDPIGAEIQRSFEVKGIGAGIHIDYNIDGLITGLGLTDITNTYHIVYTENGIEIYPASLIEKRLTVDNKYYLLDVNSYIWKGIQKRNNSKSEETKIKKLIIAEKVLEEFFKIVKQVYVEEINKDNKTPKEEKILDIIKDIITGKRNDNVIANKIKEKIKFLRLENSPLILQYKARSNDSVAINQAFFKLIDSTTNN